MATRFSGIRYAPLDSDYFLGDGSHLADESVVAVAFYNVGIPNKELMGTKWKKQDSSKKVRLKADIQATFGADVGI